MWDFLKKIGEFIFGLFSSILDASVGLLLFPITGLIRSFLNLILMIFAGILDLLTKGAEGFVSVMSIDFHSEQPLFETVFMADKFYGIFQVFAMTLLFMFFFFCLQRAMFSPEGGLDSPGELVAKTFVAGIFIYQARPIMRIVSRVFQTIFGAVSNHNEIFSDFWAGGGFSAFVETAEKKVSQDINSVFPLIKGEMTATSQLACIACQIVLLLLLWPLAKNLFKFIFEITARYAILGILILTAPLASIFFVSRSLSQTAKAWVRMIGSQFGLMVFSSIFLRGFYYLVTNFTTAFDQLVNLQPGSGNGENFMVFLLWMLMTYAWLFIALRLDSYMAALGFSTAECGIGFAASIASEGGQFLMRQLISDDIFSMLGEKATSIFGRKKRGPGAGGEVSNGPGPTGPRIGPSGQPMNVKGRDIASIARDIKRAREGGTSYTAKMNLFGASTGVAIRESLRGVDIRTKSNFDTKTAQVDGKTGIVSIQSFPDKNGKKTSYTFKPFDPQTNQLISPPESATSVAASAIKKGVQRVTGPQNKKMKTLSPESGKHVSIAGQEYLAYATGPDAKSFFTRNPFAYHKFADTHADSTQESSNVEKRKPSFDAFEIKLRGSTSGGTGIWRTISSPKPGIMVTDDYIPLGYYSVDVGAYATEHGTPDIVKIGSPQNPSAFNEYVRVRTVCAKGVKYTKEGESPVNKYNVDVPTDFIKTGEKYMVNEERRFVIADVQPEWVKKNFPSLADAEIKRARYCAEGALYAGGVVLLDVNGTPSVLAPRYHYGIRQCDSATQVEAENGTIYTMAGFKADAPDQLLDTVYTKAEGDGAAQNIKYMESSILGEVFKREKLSPAVMVCCEAVDQKAQTKQNHSDNIINTASAIWEQLDRQQGKAQQKGHVSQKKNRSNKKKSKNT